MIIIKKYSELSCEMIDLLNNANVFFSKEYSEYLENNNTDVLYLYDHSYIIPARIHTVLYIFKEAFFVSEPYKYDGSLVESEKEFLDQCIKCLRDMLKVDWLQMTPASSLFSSFPTQSQRIEFGNYILDLTKQEEEIFKGFTSKHRNMVRRGEKSEIETKIGGIELLQDYMILDSQTWDRNGKKLDNTETYCHLLKSLGEWSVIGISYKDSIPQAGILGIYNYRMFYYMYGASANRPEPGSTHYLQWEMMRHLKKIGVEKYNFVGCRIDVDENSKYYNIQHFKAGFKGELVRCYLFKQIFDSKKRKLYDYMYKLRFKTRPNDIIDQEIHKWQELNQ